MGGEETRGEERRMRNPNSFAPSREEKEKSRIFLLSFERRKRNLNSFLLFREEKEKSRISLPSFEKRKRNWQIYQTFEKTKKIRVVKTFPFCNLCLTQCSVRMR